MLKRFSLLLLVLCMGACQNAAPTATPTSAFTNTPSVSRPTLPATWTPVKAGTVSAATATPLPTDTPIPTRKLESETPLPPTWTPDNRPTEPPTPRPNIVLPTDTGIAPTETPAASPIPPTLNVPPTVGEGQTFAASCTQFTVVFDKTDRTVQARTDAHVTFTAAPGATSYHLWLRFSGQDTLLFDKEVTTVTPITIPGSMLTLHGVYGWELVPLKGQVRLCTSLAGILSVQ
jgi:hypothetical protein